MTVHATCVATAVGGILLRGASGSGKSDLALRLIAQPPPFAWMGLCQLVADDRVELTATAGGVQARAPRALAGLLEVRGVGIVPVPWTQECLLKLVIDLEDKANVPRAPTILTAAEQLTHLLGHDLPRLRLNALEASAPLKLALALRLTCG